MSHKVRGKDGRVIGKFVREGGLYFGWSVVQGVSSFRTGPFTTQLEVLNWILAEAK